MFLWNDFFLFFERVYHSNQLVETENRYYLTQTSSHFHSWSISKFAILFHFSSFLCVRKRLCRHLNYFSILPGGIAWQTQASMNGLWGALRVSAKTNSELSHFPPPKKRKRHFPWRIPIPPIPYYSMSLGEALPLPVVFRLNSYSFHLSSTE